MHCLRHYEAEQAMVFWNRVDGPQRTLDRFTRRPPAHSWRPCPTAQDAPQPARRRSADPMLSANPRTSNVHTGGRNTVLPGYRGCCTSDTDSRGNHGASSIGTLAWRRRRGVIRAAPLAARVVRRSDVADQVPDHSGDVLVQTGVQLPDELYELAATQVRRPRMFSGRR